VDANMQRSVKTFVVHSSAILLALTPILTFLFQFDFSTVNWTNDTGSYLEYHPYRQPLYGLFYNSLDALGFSLRQIAIIQVVFLGVGIALVVRETMELGAGIISLGLLIPFLWFALILYLLPTSVAFISESLVYPVMFIAGASVLTYLRTEKPRWFYLSIFLCFTAAITRTAALPIFFSSLLVLALGWFCGTKAVRNTSRNSLGIAACLVLLVPLLLGREMGQLSPSMDRSGIVLGPRVVLNPADLPIEEQKARIWNQLNSSFIEQSQELSCAERSMFESQLQEAVRYYIAPALFLAGKRQLGKTNPRMLNADDNARLRFIFESAVREHPLAYIKSSACHFWGMISAGTHLGTQAREAIFNSLKRVDPETWEIAKFRTDYPLNNFGVPLKPHTELAYLGFRVFSTFSSLLGIVLCLIVFLKLSIQKANLDPKTLVWLLPSGWLLSHSALVAVTMFPEWRFVAMNFIFQWLLLGLLLARTGTGSFASDRARQ
jgi:hypothetical protein